MSTGQNPRRHVVLKNNQANALKMYTDRNKSVCLLMPLRQLLSWGLYIFVDMFFHLININQYTCWMRQVLIIHIGLDFYEDDRLSDGTQNLRRTVGLEYVTVAS